MGYSMDEILKSLAEGSNPEESFNAALQEKVAEYSDNEGAYEMGTPETLDSDMEKIAEADAQGRIMARAFMDELEKLGVAPTAEYPADPGAIPNNPYVEVARGEAANPNLEGQTAASALISELTGANLAGLGEVSVRGSARPVAKSDPSEGSNPLAADVAKAQEREAVKTGANEGAMNILSSLYNTYFGEE